METFTSTDIFKWKDYRATLITLKIDVNIHLDAIPPSNDIQLYTITMLAVATFLWLFSIDSYQGWLLVIIFYLLQIVRRLIIRIVQKDRCSDFLAQVNHERPYYIIGGGNWITRLIDLRFL